MSLSVPPGPDVEATFVPAPGAAPPRAGRLALWRHGEAIGGADGELELVVPAGRRVRRRTVAVRWWPLGEAIDVLVDLPDGAAPSLRAWATATSLVLELMARGRLLPGRTSEGLDGWRLGPLDPADVERRDRLTASLSPAAHALAVTGARPLRVASPARLLAAFGDAVADTYVRTAAAVAAAGHPAFAAGAPTDVSAAGPWLDAVAVGTGGDVGTALRLVPPEQADGAFTAVLQLRSRQDASLVLDAADLWAAPDVVLSRFGDDAEATVLVALRRAARVWPPARRLLAEARPDRLELADDEVDDLLGSVTDDLAGAGVEVLWPVELLAQVDLRPVVATPSPAAVTGAGFSFESLCELRWQASVGGVTLTDAELTTLAEAKRPVVRLRGRWVRADPERLSRLRHRPEVSAGAALAAALGADLVVDGESVPAEVEGPLATLAGRLAALDGAARPHAPPGLVAELRPYQARGLAWLAEMAELGLGGVLADDMGLGKTIQLLALHLHRQGQPGLAGRPTLVVCPVSVVGNWAREAERFTPSVPVRRYHGPDRSLADLEPGALVLTTYGVVRRDAGALGALEWGLVAADEAQAVKNPLSRTARALRRLPAAARFALTGTPVENRLTDLWALLDWTTPGLLGPLDRFRREVAVPVERHREPQAIEALTRVVRPFLLRRRKSDPAIAPELPPKTETDRVVPLTSEQATLYAALVAETMDQVRRAEGINRRGLVLKLLTGLKQICDHPAHYLGQPGPLAGRSGKLDALDELVEVVAAEGESVLIFTQYVAMGRLLERHLAGQGRSTGFLHGSVPAARRQEQVDRFQAGEFGVFVISLKAGGTGLNLTRATHVVHYDRWWNPAVEDQASDRAWRIGQDRPVQVHRMICEGTVEDRVATLLADKRALADTVVGGGEGWITDLGDDELAALVALGAGAGDG